MKAGGVIFAAGLFALAVAARLVPHFPNVAPIGALALLSGAAFAFPLSVMIPVAAMLASDIAIGFAEPGVTASVYLSFALSALLGRTLKKKHGPFRVAGTTLAGAVVFYLATNAAVWWFSGYYERDLGGLLLSYWLALPFFRNSLIGDALYGSALLGAYFYLPAVLSRLGTKRFARMIARKTASK